MEHFTTARIKHVHPADHLSSQSLVHVHLMVRYLVPPCRSGRLRQIVGHHVLLVVLAVLDVIEDGILGSRKVAVQLRHSRLQCSSLATFLKDNLIKAR